jgi:ribosomal protein S18 acetylase RimI-like enzyme
MVCTKGTGALIYIGGGQYGGVSRNDLYDILAVKGKQYGGAAPNSKVAYKNIRFSKFGVIVSRESFTKRDNEVTLLPLSLDIRPAKPRESTTTAFVNSHNFDNDSGMVILPVVDSESFDAGYDDHPSVVQHLMGYYVPTVIQFLRSALVAHQGREVNLKSVEVNGQWKKMRQSNTKVKEGDENDLLVATDVFAIPYGHEVVMVYDGKNVTMGFDSSGTHYTGTPQTNDLELFSRFLNLEPYEAKGILTPTDESSYELIDTALKMKVVDEAEQINRLLSLQVQVYGFEDSIGPFRSLALPHARVCRNQSESFADISERQGDLTFSEMVQEELESGTTARLLMRFEGAAEMNLYPQQILDAAIIGFDIEGKNPQNGIVGNVLVALSSMEKIKVQKGARFPTVKSEIYNPVGVVGAFTDFTLEEKKRLYDLLLDASTHPGYKEGYMMVSPEELNLVLRISHKGIEKNKEQPIFRLITEIKPFSGQTISFAPSMYDEPGAEPEDKGKPGTSVFDRAQFGSRPEVIPGSSMLFEVGKRNLPILRSPNVQGFAVNVDSFESRFVGDEKVGLKERFSKQNERLTMKVPLEQLPIRNMKANPWEGLPPTAMTDWKHQNYSKSFYHGTTLSNARELFNSEWFNVADWKRGHATFTDSLDLAIFHGLRKWIHTGQTPENPIVILELDSEGGMKALAKTHANMPSYWDLSGVRGSSYYSVEEPIPTYFLRPIPYTKDQFMFFLERMRIRYQPGWKASEEMDTPGILFGIPAHEVPVPTEEQYRSLQSPLNNPPAEDVQWTVDEKNFVWEDYPGVQLQLTGKGKDGDIKMTISIIDDMGRYTKKVFPSLFHHMKEIRDIGYSSFAVVEDIRTTSKGKGLGQAAYLKAAEYTTNEFGAPLITGNHSLDSEKSWRGVERNLPEEYKVVKWIGGEYPEWEAEDAFSYYRILWYVGPLNNPPYSVEHFPIGESSPRFKTFERKHRFVAVDDETDEMTGLLVVDENTSNLYIVHFQVLEGYQQQGIGVQLLQSLVDSFPEDEIILFRQPHDIPDNKLKDLYERFGFSDVGRSGNSNLMEMRRRPIQ